MTAAVWKRLNDGSYEAVVGEQRVYVAYQAGWHPGMSGWDYGWVNASGVRSFAGQRALLLDARLKAEELGQPQ